METFGRFGRLLGGKSEALELEGYIQCLES
jgi:hypothetical protein